MKDMTTKLIYHGQKIVVFQVFNSKITVPILSNVLAGICWNIVLTKIDLLEECSVKTLLEQLAVLESIC